MQDAKLDPKVVKDQLRDPANLPPLEDGPSGGMLFLVKWVISPNAIGKRPAGMDRHKWIEMDLGIFATEQQADAYIAAHQHKIKIGHLLLVKRREWRVCPVTKTRKTSFSNPALNDLFERATNAVNESHRRFNERLDHARKTSKSGAVKLYELPAGFKETDGKAIDEAKKLIYETPDTPVVVESTAPDVLGTDKGTDTTPAPVPDPEKKTPDPPGPPAGLDPSLAKLLPPLKKTGAAAATPAPAPAIVKSKTVPNSPKNPQPQKSPKSSKGPKSPKSPKSGKSTATKQKPAVPDMVG